MIVKKHAAEVSGLQPQIRPSLSVLYVVRFLNTRPTSRVLSSNECVGGTDELKGTVVGRFEQAPFVRAPPSGRHLLHAATK